MKLAIHLEVPTEQEEYSLEDRIEDCMERVEFGTDPEAYMFLRKVNNHLANKFNCGKCSERGRQILSKLTPFMAKHGLHDPRGVTLAEGLLTNPDYRKERDDD